MKLADDKLQEDIINRHQMNETANRLLQYAPLKRTKRYIASGSNRKVPHILFIETAIFVDRDLFRHMAKNYPKNTEGNLIRFVMAMINGVQLLYHHPSLGHQINFILKRLEILHNDPKELRRSSDIDIFLNSFCMWQRKFNPIADDNIFHFDHAVILTGECAMKFNRVIHTDHPLCRMPFRFRNFSLMFRVFLRLFRA